MTQALMNNTDIINNDAYKINNYAGNVDSENVNSLVTDKNKKGNFKQILDKTIENNHSEKQENKQTNDNSSTQITNDTTKTDESVKDNQIEDMDSIVKTLIGDISEQAETFKEVLAQATNEANMEKSLDLTLARDIADIIAQLKGAVEININTDSNIDNSEFSDTLASETEITADIEEDAAISKFVDVNTDEDGTNSTLSLDEDMFNELNIESVSAETDTAGQETMTNQQTAEELGVKVMLNQDSENFDFNLEKLASTNTAKPAEVTPEKIIEQVTKHLDSFKLNSKVNIVLNPEHLGKLNLQILNSKDGLSAQFTVTTNEARELLMKGLDGLKESLLSQGINVDNISVKISETEKGEYNPDWLEQEGSEKQEQQGNRQYKEKEKGLFEKTIAENLKKEDGNV